MLTSFCDTLDSVEKPLWDAKLDKSQIHDTVRVVGPTRTPGFRRFYETSSVEKTWIWALALMKLLLTVQLSRWLSGDNSIWDNAQDLQFLDVTPLLLGTETAGRAMTVLIKHIIISTN